jgi:hypothetical protein
MAANSVGSNSPDGDTLGATAADLAGFHGTAVVQAAVTTAPAATGVSNSSPYGFTGATQGDAVITWIRAVDVALKAKGILASS